jgi:hypothetical protein
LRGEEIRRWEGKVELLAERGWGKPAAFEPLDGDPLDLADAEAAAEEFRARILRLAAEPDPLQ